MFDITVDKKKKNQNLAFVMIHDFDKNYIV